MAKLSTPSHPCETRFVDDKGFPVDKCGCDAYRRAPAGSSRAGQWECARCRHARERYEQRTRPAWNCVDYIGGMHYTPSDVCLWCGKTRDVIALEYV